MKRLLRLSFACKNSTDPKLLRGRGLAFTLVLEICLLAAVSAKGLNLSGVLLYGADERAEIIGPIWQTGNADGTRPLGFTRWPLPGTRGMPFPLAPDGSLRDRSGRLGLPLWSGAHVTHLFWQFRPGEFPAALVLNLFFDGDLLSPGISVLVYGRYGLTNFVPNPAPYTLSFDLNTVPNPTSAEFTDGSTIARITAAFFFSSSPAEPESLQWRPADLVNVDRVGLDRLDPDGLPDGVLVFQLDVLPVQSPATSTTGRRDQPLAGVRPTAPSGAFGWLVAPEQPQPRAASASSARASLEQTPAALATVAPTPPPSAAARETPESTPETESALTPSTPQPTPHATAYTTRTASPAARRSTPTAKPTARGTASPAPPSPRLNEEPDPSPVRTPTGD
ncbi:MAG: hypothetical protein N3C12_07405 [Candidatus Binatia bacterium]|nr:hypothetical protein [Candidatus Binatia bacterium]